MPNTKYILEKIKIEGAMQDLLAKSNGENVSVTYNGTDMTLAAALAQIFTSVNALPSDSDVDTKISAAIGNLVNGAPETGDTLKELFDLIGNNTDAMATLNAAIGGKVSQTDFNALKSTVDGLGTLATKNQVSEEELSAELKAKISAAADGNHSHANKAELDKIAEGDVAKWNNIRGVRYGTTAPEDMQNGELFIRVVSEA